MKETVIAGQADDVQRAKEAVGDAAERVQDAPRDFLKLFGYGAAGLMMGGLSVGESGLPQFASSAHAESNKKSPYEMDAAPVARTGLTSFNPFSLDYDYTAVLDEGQSAQQRADTSAAVARLRADYDIVIRNNSVPHTLRGNPTQNAAPGTLSSPLRVSTHLFHSMDDVDRLIEALIEVVPHP